MSREGPGISPAAMRVRRRRRNGCWRQFHRKSSRTLSTRPPWADFAHEHSDAIRESLTGTPLHSTPGFPDVGYKNAGEKIVNSTDPFEHGVTDDRNDHREYQLMAVPDGRCRRVCQDEQREEEHGLQIGRSEDLRHPRGI